MAPSNPSKKSKTNNGAASVQSITTLLGIWDHWKDGNEIITMPLSFIAMGVKKVFVNRRPHAIRLLALDEKLDVGCIEFLKDHNTELYAKLAASEGEPFRFTRKERW
jgi:hypothetical protein